MFLKYVCTSWELRGIKFSPVSARLEGVVKHQLRENTFTIFLFGLTYNNNVFETRTSKDSDVYDMQT